MLLPLFCFLRFTAMYAQTPSYFHYTSSDGLASSTVYEIIQDRNGFIWFATLNGMSRFDGKRFTTFRTTEGLNSNAIISLAEGEKGELYIGNYEKGVNVFRNGRIGNYCSEVEEKSFALSYLLLAPSGPDIQKIYAYRSWGNINSITGQKNKRPVTHSINTNPLHVNRLAILKNNEVIALTSSGLFSFHQTRFIKKRITGLPDTELICFARAGDGSYFLGTKGMIYRIKDHQVDRKYPVKLAGNNGVCALLADKNNNLWFSVMNSGFFCIPCGSDNITDIGSKMGLRGTLVNHFLEDREGNIWLSTFGKGVYCLNNLYLKNYNENDGLSSNSVYSIVKELSGKLVIGTFNGLNILDQGTFVHIQSKSKKTLTEYIYSIKKTGNEFYISDAFGEAGVKKITYKGIILHFFGQPSFCKTSNGLYLFGGSGNYISVRHALDDESAGSSRFSLFKDSPGSNRINELFEDSKKNIWAGTGLGLCKITVVSDSCREWKKIFFPGDQVLNARINAIAEDNTQTVWFAGERGVASYTLGNASVKSYTNFKGYDLSSSTSLAIDQKNRLWIGNMKGLFLYDGTSVKFLNRLTGLPSDEVLSLCSDTGKNLLYIGTSNGFSILDISLFDRYNPSPPRVKLIGIKAGDSVYTDFIHLVFQPEQHDVYIDFKALNFSSPGSVKFSYKLNNEWIATDYDFLNFIALKNGTYNLQIKARAQNTGWGEPCLLTFRMMPRFYETIWFYLLIFSLFASLTFLIVNWRQRRYNDKNRKELELAERFNELKHQALSAMMNPHFISNSLNSVQYLVNSGQYEEANDYIAMIAKLMRKNLDTAGNGFILLSEEIGRLRLYLELEKLRFRESFSYEIVTGADIVTDAVMIPNMIIQPFVENSLWHGIIHSGRAGLLTVSFTFEEVDIDSLTGRSLIIKITDNGIGITEAKKNIKEDHISKGIQIIEERLRLLSAKMQLPQPIMFEDLGNQGNNAHGTEVIISLPPSLYKMTFPGSAPPSSPAV